VLLIAVFLSSIRYNHHPRHGRCNASSNVVLAASVVDSSLSPRSAAGATAIEMVYIDMIAADQFSSRFSIVAQQLENPAQALHSQPIRPVVVAGKPVQHGVAGAEEEQEQHDPQDDVFVHADRAFFQMKYYPGKSFYELSKPSARLITASSETAAGTQGGAVAEPAVVMWDVAEEAGLGFFAVEFGCVAHEETRARRARIQVRVPLLKRNVSVSFVFTARCPSANDHHSRAPIRLAHVNLAGDLELFPPSLDDAQSRTTTAAANTANTVMSQAQVEELVRVDDGLLVVPPHVTSTRLGVVHLSDDGVQEFSRAHVASTNSDKVRARLLSNVASIVTHAQAGSLAVLYECVARNASAVISLSVEIRPLRRLEAQWVKNCGALPPRFLAIGSSSFDVADVVDAGVVLDDFIVPATAHDEQEKLQRANRTRPFLTGTSVLTSLGLFVDETTPWLDFFVSNRDNAEMLIIESITAEVSDPSVLFVHVVVPSFQFLFYLARTNEELARQSSKRLRLRLVCISHAVAAVTVTLRVEHYAPLSFVFYKACKQPVSQISRDGTGGFLLLVSDLFLSLAYNLPLLSAALAILVAAAWALRRSLAARPTNQLFPRFVSATTGAHAAASPLVGDRRAHFETSRLEPDLVIPPKRSA